MATSHNPFKEQVDFFQNKQLVPTQHWDDLKRDAHDTGFMVAGAMQMDLLADFHGSLLLAQKNGTTLKDFTANFERIVAKHGWTGWTGEGTEAGRAWRAKIIFETNMRTSYQAGRWQQFQANKDKRPYLIYKHSHSVTTPRPEHLRWDGLIIHIDDPWLRVHYPPQGFGCKCTMFALSDRDLQRMGKDGPDQAPDNGTYDWVDPKTGEIHTFPVGVQPFWDYAPGASLSSRARDAVIRKAAGLPDGLGGQLTAFIKSIKPEGISATDKALGLGIKTVDFAGEDKIAEMVTQALEDVAKLGVALPDHVIVDGERFTQWAKHLDVKPETLVAAFVPAKNKSTTFLALSPFYKHWGNLGADAKKLYDKHEWSTPHQFHIIYHELGHLQHYLMGYEAYYLALDTQLVGYDLEISARVSTYAKDNAAEFIAEVFAGLLANIKYDPEIMQLYDRLNGPRYDF